MTAREQQLSLWALEAWGHVLPVLLPHAPLGVRDAARAVMSSRDVLAHLEEPSTPPSPASAPLLLAGARDAMLALHDLDHRRAPGDAYAAILMFLGNLASAGSACELTRGSPLSAAAAATLPFPLPLVRPDVLLGLNALEVPVSVGVDAVPLVPAGVKAGLYAASIPDVQVSLCDSPSAPWFPWLFACLAPLDGGLGAAHVNVLTAMRTALGLVLKMNTAALERDPANSLPLPSIWRRAYGVYGAGSMWRLLVMVADEKGDFAVSEIWCGSATSSVQLLQFIALFAHIAGEAESRKAYVSNWLYSVRASSAQRDLFQPHGSAHTTPRTNPVVLMHTPVQKTPSFVSPPSRILQPLPLPTPMPSLPAVPAPAVPAPIPVVRRRERRSLSEISSGIPLSPRTAYHSSSSYGVLDPPSPSAWMSPSRHARRASTTVIPGPSRQHPTLLSPFPNRSPNGSVATYLAAAAERSWSGIRRPPSHSHSVSTNTNSESPTLSDRDFGDENSSLALRRFS